MTAESGHRLTVEATPNRPWPYRWRCSCGGVEGSADSEADAATKHAAHESGKADRPSSIPPCPTCGGKRGTFMLEQDGTTSWTCARCGDEWPDVGDSDG